jgi:hypothetical protein
VPDKLTQVTNECVDCTPGYVCLGKTGSSEPYDRKKQNGYRCPEGHYCPKGSYKERPCPPGTYSKYEGAVSLDYCFPCKQGTYNDAFGQPGCKKCGPTSTSSPTISNWAVTCECAAKNRKFVKSIGSCLCKRGFRPKDNKLNVDSVVDCEAEVEEVCAIG